MDLLELINGFSDSPKDCIDSMQKSLFLASSSGNLMTFMQLLEKNVSPNFSYNDFTPLHIASKRNHVAIVQALINNSPCLAKTTTSNGRTAMMIAAFEGHVEVISILASISSSDCESMDTMGNCALHYAAWGGKLSACKLLVEKYNGDVFKKNAEGLVPIQFATIGNYVEVVMYLLSFDTDKSAITCTSASGLNTLHRASRYGALDTIMLLLCDPDCPYSADNVPPLIDVNALSGNHSTATHYAVENGHMHVLSYLVGKYRVDINAANDWDITPLYLACTGGFVNIVSYLLQHGASASCSLRTRTGATPLHSAAAAGKHEVCRLLTAYTAVDIWSEDNEGQTPIDLALSSGYRELASRLAGWSYVQDRTQMLLEAVSIESLSSSLDLL